MIEHHLGVTRTARYFTLGDPAGARHVWFALHGYGQLASAFIGYLDTMNTGDRLIVAPEALSRFYLEEGRGPIGASWMTKEDRKHEIEDYVRYLDAVYNEVRAKGPPGARYYVLGFSQGVATAARWMDFGVPVFAGTCFWAGSLPPDLSVAGAEFAGNKVAIVAGNSDSYLSADWRKREMERFSSLNAVVREFSFHGGHRLDRAVLAEVAAFFEEE